LVDWRESAWGDGPGGNRSLFPHGTPTTLSPWSSPCAVFASASSIAKTDGANVRARIEDLKLPESEIILLMDCLVNFVIGRFPKLNLEEVLAMFQLTPLEQTRVGQQRYQQGLEQGLSKGLPRVSRRVFQRAVRRGSRGERSSVESAPTRSCWHKR